MIGLKLVQGLYDRWSKRCLARRRLHLPEVLRLHLVAALEESGSGRQRANHYVVKVPQTDFAMVTDSLPELKAELCAAVTTEAQRRDYQLAGPAVVDIVPVPEGTIKVEVKEMTLEPAAPTAGDQPTLTFRPRRFGVTTERRPARSLVVLRGPDRGSTFTLWGDRVFVGRRETNHVVLHDKGVSRVHLELIWKDGQVLLRDLGSLNGTRVNGERVAETHLKAGDQITLGSTCLEYRE